MTVDYPDDIVAKHLAESDIYSSKAITAINEWLEKTGLDEDDVNCSESTTYCIPHTIRKR